MPYYKFDESRPIEVYFNLHRKEFSIRQDGLVVQHLSYLDMQDVTFHVQPAGNARVRRRTIYARGIEGLRSYSPYR